MGHAPSQPSVRSAPGEVRFQPPTQFRVAPEQRTTIAVGNGLNSSSVRAKAGWPVVPPPRLRVFLEVVLARAAAVRAPGIAWPFRPRAFTCPAGGGEQHHMQHHDIVRSIPRMAVRRPNRPRQVQLDIACDRLIAEPQPRFPENRGRADLAFRIRHEIK